MIKTMRTSNIEHRTPNAEVGAKAEGPKRTIDFSTARRRNEVFTLIRAERHRQEQLFKSGTLTFRVCDPDVAYGHKLAVLVEETGEVAEAILEQTEASGLDDLRKELVQVAAVAVAWLESLEEE